MPIDALRRKTRELEHKKASLHAWTNLRSQIMMELVQRQRDLVALQQQQLSRMRARQDSSDLTTELQTVGALVAQFEELFKTVQAEVARLSQRPGR